MLVVQLQSWQLLCLGHWCCRGLGPWRVQMHAECKTVCIKSLLFPIACHEPKAVMPSNLSHPMCANPQEFS